MKPRTATKDATVSARPAPAARLAHAGGALLLAAAALLLPACTDNSLPALLAAGKTALAKHDTRTAVIQFKSALQKDAASGEARYWLGMALLQAGDARAAMLELEKALNLKYDDGLVVPALVKAMVASGHARKATEVYDTLQLSDKAAQAELKASLASAWAQLGNRERAQAAVKAALAAQPEHGTARVLEARILSVERRHDEALAATERLLAAQPGLIEGWQLKGEILWYVRRDEAGALAAFNRVLEIDSGFVPAHSAIVSVHMARRDTAAVATQVDKLKAVQPRHPQTRFLEAQLAFVQRDYKQAREMILGLLRIAPEHAGVLQLAGANEFRGGSLLLAETYLNKALQKDPGLRAARMMLSQTYLRLGQAPRALTVIQPLVEGSSGDAEAIAVAADAFLSLADPRRAEALFRRAAESNPDDLRIRSALALTQLARGDSGGFAELEAIAARDKSTFADMALISARLKRGEYELALQAADQLAKKQPDTAQVATTRGRIHLARNDRAKARAEFDKALAADPLYFPAAVSLATLDIDDKQPEKALKRFEDVLRGDPRHYQARMAIAELKTRTGAPRDEVTQVLAEAIKSSPAEPAPRLALIDHHLRNKEFKSALTTAQDAIAALPNSHEVLDALGRAQLESGDLQQALSSFRKLAGANALAALPHMRLADVYTAMKDKRAAELSLRKALELQPDLVQAQRGLVEMALADNRPKDAVELARSMQRQRPKDESGYLFEGQLQVRLKNPEGALAAYRLGVERAATPRLAARYHGALLSLNRRADADRFAVDWERRHPQDPDFDAHLGSVLLLRGEFAQAEQRYRRVVAQHGDDASALNNLAWLLLRQGKPGALPFAERANQLQPNRPPVMDTLASALLAEGRAKEALELQRKAVERAPEDFALRLNLAKIAIKADDKALARSELEKIARAGKRFAGQDEVASLLKTL